MEYLVRFADGRAAGISTVVKGELFGWPLPERLCVLAHPGLSENMAVWAQGDPGDLPSELTDSPNVEVFVKVRESQIPVEKHAELTHVMPGAEYRLET